MPKIISSIAYRLSLILALLSVPCFLIGCLAFDTYTTIVRSFSWFKSADGDADAYFGLRMVYITSDSSFEGNKIHFDDKSACTESWCEQCAQDGRWAFALNIVAALLALICGSRLLRTYLARVDLFVAFTAAVVSAIASLVGLSLFMSDCMNAVDGSFSGELQWGSGSVLTNLGMVFMWIVAALQVITVACY
jgi:hypothetical protein